MEQRNRTWMGMGLALAVALGCGGEEDPGATPSDEATDTPPAATEPAAPEPAAEPAAAPAEAAAAQSTGTQTEVVEGDRPTLVDREIGVQITCPPDQTWRCRLDGSGMWNLRDMSGNTLAVRVVAASDAAAALDAEIAHVRGELPVTGVASREGDTAVLDVGPNPEWSSPVDRRAWVRVKQIGERFYACHGQGAARNFDNAQEDYQAMCESLSAVE